MFTFDKESLLGCLTLGYACYNGMLFFPTNPDLKKEASYADGKWFQVSAAEADSLTCVFSVLSPRHSWTFLEQAKT